MSMSTASSGSLPDPAPKGASAAAARRPIDILLVDDEPKNLTVLETVLDNPQYRLIKAVSADEALLALVNHDFALIILDIQMPIMSGFELAHMIKQRKKTAGIPIIFLTAFYSEDQHVLEGYETGAVDYLHKPVNARILQSKVAVFADLYRTTQDLAATNQTLQGEAAERSRVQDELRRLNVELEDRVAARTNELVEANAALRESEEQLRLAQEAAKVGIWSLDLETGLGLWTDAAWDIFDPDGKGEQVTRSRWLSYVHPDDRQRAETGLRTPSRTGRYRDEYRVLFPGGSVKWVEAVGAFDRSPDGRPVAIRGAVRDITEQKELEIELKETGRRKDEFLAMLGHELRNPLAPIRNAVSILRKIGGDDPDHSWCQDIIDRQAEQLTRIVDDLLDVSRVSRGKIQLHRARLDFSRAVQNAVETTRHLIEARGHTLHVTLPDGPLLVDGDLARLSQVVANLLNNAAKYTDEGGTIWVTAEAGDGPEPSAIVRVRDTGRGFDSSVRENLFSLFFQADRTIDRSDGGLGIGLALVRSLVEMHGGSVEARSPGRGQGSEFAVRLPQVVEAPAPAGPLASRLAEGMPPARILVVDDNQDAARTLGMLLSVMGHEVSLAHDGDRAVEAALAERPDAIFLDIGLPKRNGYEVCEFLRSQGMVKPLIVAMTGYGQEEDRRRSDEAGFDEHLVKPVGLQMIQQVLRGYLLQHSS